MLSRVVPMLLLASTLFRSVVAQIKLPPQIRWLKMRRNKKLHRNETVEHSTLARDYVPAVIVERLLI